MTGAVPARHSTKKRYFGSAFFIPYQHCLQQFASPSPSNLLLHVQILALLRHDACPQQIRIAPCLFNRIIFMSDNASIPMEKAITVGLSEVTLARTLELFAAHLSSGSDRVLNFRGDLAERYNYDKIKPAMKPAQSQGNVVFIEAVSQKTGETAHYQILANQWKLLEVLARLN